MAARSKRKVNKRSKAHQKHTKAKRKRRLGRASKVGYGQRLRRKKAAKKK